MAADDELIVVDDGSTDATRAEVEKFGDRVRYLRIKNVGAGNARNIGLKHATRPLIAFLDSDDSWAPFKLRLQREVLAQHPELVYCCSNFSLHTPAGDTPSYLRQWWTGNTDPESVFGIGERLQSRNGFAQEMPECRLHVADLFKPMLENHVICIITLLYRQERAPDVKFPEDLPTCEDWEFCARLARCGLGGYVDCDTAINHAHSGPRLTDAHRLTRAATRLKMMSRVWGSDPAFMAMHGEDYAAVWSDQCLQAADWLVRHGRNREAREYLAKAGHAPLPLRIAASLPVPQCAVELARRGRDLLLGRN